MTTTLLRRAEGMPDAVGPFFLGIVVNYLLWGVQITQSFYYYRCYRRTDSKWIKVAVGLLFVSDAIQSIAASEGAWHMLVDKWGNPDGIFQLQDWGMHILTMMGAFTASIVHAFYAHRIWKMLTPPYNHIYTAIILSLSCLQLVAGIGCTIFQFTSHIALGEYSRIKTWISIWLITASITDIIIVGLMSGQLSKLHRGNDVISKIMWLTVETGLATAIVQIMDIIIYLIWPNKTYHGVPTVIAPKVYSISMLVILNSRPINKAAIQEASYGDPSHEEPIHANNVDIYTAHTITFSKDLALRSTLETGNKSLRSVGDGLATDRGAIPLSPLGKEVV